MPKFPKAYGAYETPTTEENIEDRIDDWHEGGGELPTRGETTKTLHGHLGLSEGQFRHWVEKDKLPCLHLTGYWIHEGSSFRCYQCQCQFHLDDLPKIPRDIEVWEGE